MLGVHENTVRYRLSRIAEVTHLDVVMNGDDQLAVQMALLILRLEGKLPGSDIADVVASPNALTLGSARPIRPWPTRTHCPRGSLAGRRPHRC
jgi:hypothetical protein